METKTICTTDIIPFDVIESVLIKSGPSKIKNLSKADTNIHHSAIMENAEVIC